MQQDNPVKSTIRQNSETDLLQPTVVSSGLPTCLPIDGVRVSIVGLTLHFVQLHDPLRETASDVQKTAGLQTKAAAIVAAPAPSPCAHGSHRAPALS